MPRRDRAPAADGLLSATLTSAALVGALLAGFALVASGFLGFKEVPAPFVWTDVALVYVLCNLPLAAALAAPVRGRGGVALCLALGLASVAAAAALWALESPRGAIALGAAAGLMLLVSAAHQPTHARSAPRENYLGVILLGLAVMIGLPRIYLQARERHDERNLAELLEQSRLGEARALSRQLLALAPARQVHGQPLQELVAQLDQASGEIEARVTLPLPRDATDDARLARARDLAILGRTLEALQALDASTSLAQSPDALNLRGTIQQTRLEWRSSAESFGRAAAALRSLTSSPERTAGLAEATTGVAFAERKLGHNVAAEAAYQELLQLDPSADSHFLLAQFYEGTQQAAQAQFHARQAMTLAPERYQQPGQRLIDKLVTHHFGCWGAAATERLSQ